MKHTPTDFAPPADPVAAVTHPDPTDYYGRLLAEQPFHRDERLGLWVASSAAAVAAVLTSPACRVRSVTEPVPKAILGSAAGAIFRQLVRMKDGEAHRPLKQAVAATFDALAAARIARASERWAECLASEIGPATEAAQLQEVAFALPVYTIGSLLGVADELLPRVAQLMEEFIGCLSPAGTAEQLERGKIAAGQLCELFRSQLPDAGSVDGDTLLSELAVQARRFGCDDLDVVGSNGIGFLMQARDATAALIKATILALARRPEVYVAVTRTPALLATVAEEVLRYDSPVQNTRRFVAAPVTIEGQQLQPGEAVLVVLAAANLDPQANPDPDRFELGRQNRQIFTYGIGPHACPGRMLATTIATAAVARLLGNGVDLNRLELHPAYLPYPNIRFPLLRYR